MKNNIIDLDGLSINTDIPEDEGLWETVIDFTKIKKGGISVSELISYLRSGEKPRPLN